MNLFRYRYWMLGIAALGTYSALAELPNAEGHKHVTVCLFKLLTGYPCAGCGTGRGLKYFFHLDFYNALMANPVSVVIGIAMVFFFFAMIFDWLTGRSICRDIFRYRLPVWLDILLLILILANWYWNIKKGM